MRKYFILILASLFLLSFASGIELPDLQVKYIAPTPLDGEVLENGTLNVAISMLGNATSEFFYLYNETGDLISEKGHFYIPITPTEWLNISANWTGLAPGIYYYNVTVFGDNESVSTETRTVCIGYIFPPIVNFVPPTPENNSYLPTNYFTINFSYTGIVSHKFYNIYSNQKIFIPPYQNLYSPPIYSSEPEYFAYFLQDLVDGTYFYDVTVSNPENFNTTETRTVTIDTAYPEIQFIEPTPEDALTIDTNSFVANISINETNPANLTFSLFNATGDLIDEQIFDNLDTLEVTWIDLGDGTYEYFVTLEDKAGHQTTINRTLTIDTSSGEDTGGDGGGDSGSSGSSSSSTTSTSLNLGGTGSCFSEWSCSEWSECENNLQTRLCTPAVPNCTPKPKPATEMSCSAEIETEEPEEEKGFFARLTGAITGGGVGARTVQVLGALVFIAIIIGIYFFIKIKIK